LKRTNTVSTKLWKLAKIITDTVKKLQTSGGIMQTRTVYVKPKFKEFEFKDGTVSRMSWTFEYVDKMEWHWHDEFKFLETTVKKLQEYSDTFKLISKTYGVAEPQAEFWLSRFAQILSRMSLEEVKQEDVIQLITTFVADLEGAPKHWIVRAWLNGLWTKEPEVTIFEGLTLRHPRQTDFESERPLESAIFGFQEEVIPMFQYPSAILEMMKRAKDQPELHYELETLLITLRLFRVGSVAPLKIYWNSESVLGFGHYTTGPSRVAIPTEKYSLSAAELDTLRTFIQRVKPIIPQEFLRGGETTDYMVTSLQRFNDAMLKAEPPESRMTFAIMSLEALYLKSGEREELEHRLSQRIAKILSILGHDPMEVYNTLRRSYDIRSKFVHGEPLEKADRQYTAENLSKVLEYNRVSIVASLQLKEKIAKEQLLNLIDNSLLSPQAETKLNEKIKQFCSVH
jgi:uncharacterized tellurite resistance protein B-like protein